MSARPGRLQAAFTAGEISPLLHERTTLKYFSTGLDAMVNLETIPQGGFTLSPGLEHRGFAHASAARLIPFTASNGQAYDLAFHDGGFTAWGADGLLQTVTMASVTGALLPEMNHAQTGDTLLLFHRDLETPRIKHLGPTNWTHDLAPFQNVFTYDYGGPVGGGSYTNGVAAVWVRESVGFDTDTVYTLTVSGQTTESLTTQSDEADLIALIKSRIEALPNVQPGITVTVPETGKVEIAFTGAGNEGDGWVLSGEVLNKADAAIVSFKKTAGVAPGEPVFSAARGWPSCGTFFAQRLLLGGFKALPNAWCASVINDQYNFDERFTAANGPFLVPMDVPGGERVERLVPGQNLQIFTTRGEYWLAERTLSRTEVPNTVLGSTQGTRAGAPIVPVEGAAIYVQASGDVINEFRYTDIEGNYRTLNISLLATHMVEDITDMAVSQSVRSNDGSTIHLVTGGGQARHAVVLREQEVTAFMRRETGNGTFKAVAVNGRSETHYLVERPGGRALERLAPDLLLDEAQRFALESPAATLTGLSRFDGRAIWVLADGHVLGPYTVSGGAVTLPFAVSAGHLGTWTPPVARLLPPPRDIGPNVVLKRKARIHSAHVSVIDTTSLAIAVNGQAPRNVPLVRFGDAADTPELQRGFTGTLKVRGLRGYRDEPQFTITQTRPGRMTVRSVTIETDL